MLIYNEKTCFETANIYVALRNFYVALLHFYVALLHFYVALLHIYTCFRLSRVMESRSMSMQEYLSLNIKAMFQPLSVPATGQAGRQKAERQKAEGRKQEGRKKLFIRGFSYLRAFVLSAFLLSAFVLSCFRAFVLSCSQNFTAQYNYTLRGIVLCITSTLPAIIPSGIKAR